MSQPVPFTLIIPAHNEEAVIARCLEAALKDAPENGRPQIIVAANGCSDRTVEIARLSAPDALILDIPTGSKTGAINAANAKAEHPVRLYLDADVECSYPSLQALATALSEPGIMTAAPAIHLDTSRCNMVMKAYYRAWARQPYAKAGKGGAGCYGLTEASLEAVGKFPPIIGDDIWIHTRFPDEQKRYITHDANGDPVVSTVYPPRTAFEQIKVEARRQLGNAEVRELHPSPYLAGARNGGGLRTALRSGAGPIELLVFFAIKFCSRTLSRLNRNRGGGKTWARDMSTRQA